MTNLTDTDRTNIYSYRGTDFTGDLQAYLRGAGYDVRTVDIVNGYMGTDENRCLERTTGGTVVANCKEDEGMSGKNRKTVVHINGGFDIARFNSFADAMSHVLNYNDGFRKEIYYIDGEREYLEWSRPACKDDEDVVNNPSHYKHGGIETIDLIKAFLTPEEWRGYLKGTLYAYRDRAPYKGQTEQDYEKAKRYWEWLKEAMGETE